MAALLQTRRRSQQQPRRRYPQMVGNAFARTRYRLPNQLSWPKYRFYDSTSKILIKDLTKEKLLTLCDGNKLYLLTHEDSTVKIVQVVAEELANDKIRLKITGYLLVMHIVEKHFEESFVLFLRPESSTSYFVQSVNFEFFKEVDLTTTPPRVQEVSKVVEIRQHELYIKQDTNGEEPIWSFQDKPLTMALLSAVDRSKMNNSSDIGNIGEREVYHCLIDVFGKNSVKLVSSDKNSSCDIEIEIEEEEEEEGKEEEEEEEKEKKLEEEKEKEKKKKKVYVEVKSTNYTQKNSIILSKREWEEGALKQGDSYIIARPVLEASQVKLTLWKNPLKCHRIGFFLERKRKRQP